MESVTGNERWRWKMRLESQQADWALQIRPTPGQSRSSLGTWVMVMAVTPMSHLHAMWWPGDKRAKMTAHQRMDGGLSLGIGLVTFLS